MRDLIWKSFCDYGPLLTSAEICFILNKRDDRESVRFDLSEMMDEGLIVKHGERRKSRYAIAGSPVPSDFDTNPPQASPSLFVLTELHEYLARNGVGVKMAAIAEHLGVDVAIARYVAAAGLENGCVTKTGNKAATRYLPGPTPKKPSGERYKPMPDGVAPVETSQPKASSSRSKPTTSSTGLKPPKRLKALNKARECIIKGLRKLMKDHDKSVPNSKLRELIDRCLK